MNTNDIAKFISNLQEKVVLIYGFNSVGKTRLSVAYKDETKNANGGNHAGVYYNAFSEDLFVWDNNSDENEENTRIVLQRSSLNRFHNLLDEKAIREKLRPYNPSYDFLFNYHDNQELGIEGVSFFLNRGNEGGNLSNIKISRGEERIFVWCFFMALFEVEGWADVQSKHFFIDDPVSSLDDHNIFVTAKSLFDLIESHHENRKIIISTHHVGLFSILSDWLCKGEKADRYRNIIKQYILTREGDELFLKNPKNDVFLYHLRLLQILDQANREKQLYAYHFALLRQVLENVGSFLGVGRINYVLEQIGIEDTSTISNIMNKLTHRNLYYPQMDAMVPDNVALFRDVFERLNKKYNFVIHSNVS